MLFLKDWHAGKGEDRRRVSQCPLSRQGAPFSKEFCKLLPVGEMVLVENPAGTELEMFCHKRFGPGSDGGPWLAWSRALSNERA